MTIAIVGSGALGLYYGALLLRGGADVKFLLRRDYEAICHAGLKVFSINGDFAIPVVPGYRRTEEIGPVDLVIVGLKTFANHRLSELITPLLGPNTQILTLQNGLGNEEALAELFGAERVLGGVALLGANRGEPGTVYHLAAGRIVIGEYLPHDSDRLAEIAALFNRCGITCQITTDLRKSRWEKLVWNIPFNGLSALLRYNTAELLAVTAMRALIRELMIEVIMAANAQGLSAPILESYADQMITYTDTMGAYKPSMQVDREEGRPLETAAIFRVPLKFGREKQVVMSRVSMLATLLEQMALVEK
jgi:2-dehydropantoate 2-reductase